MLRLLIPFAAGIVLQEQLTAPVIYWYVLLLAATMGLILFPYLSVYARYSRSWITGVGVHLLFVSSGAILYRIHDITKDPYQWSEHYTAGDGIVLSPDEAPKEKKNASTATASVHYIIHNGKPKAFRGKVLLYFEKDSAGKVAAPGPVRPGGGSFLLVRAVAQPVAPSGNPGAFDFRQYARSKGITHQLFLKRDDYILLPLHRNNFISQGMERIRQWVLNVFRRYIRDPEERGLAEALLIGYKDDLDRSLVRTYSNTGVVHIIAISGLHLGLIYGLLVLLCRPFRHLKWIRALLIIIGLWTFSILAGAQPSVLRSALMFTCVVLGELAARRGTAVNSLLCSAFLLLCIDPGWLWDAGFLLSYTAVLSIMLYQRPLYHLLYIRNKISDFIWQMNTVTLSAQLLTFPVSVYFFHQFPVYFLLTNLLAVPVSSLIVLAEILLLALSGIPLLGKWTGILISLLIRIMNTWVRHLEWMPFSSWTGLQISLAQAIILLGIIVLFAHWLMEKQRRSLLSALLCCLLFMCFRTISFNQALQQKNFIVYNTSRRSTMEFISGRNALFLGDLPGPDTADIYHSILLPAHTVYRVRRFREHSLQGGSSFFSSGRFSVFIPGTDGMTLPPGTKVSICVLSRRNYQLPEGLHPEIVVADGTLSGKALQRIREACSSLNIRFHSVREQGAFVMTLP